MGKIQCFCYISISVLSWMRRAFCNLLKTLDISESIGWYSSTEFNYKKFKEIWDAFETFFRISRGVTGCIFEFPNSKMCDIVLRCIFSGYQVAGPHNLQFFSYANLHLQFLESHATNSIPKFP